MESSSQSEQIEKLKRQLAETEAVLSANNSEEQSAKHQTELSRVQLELKKSQESGKEEEEKRVKAISLLKTVRQKLVKAEKDRDDALKEIADHKTKDGTQRDRDKADRAKFQRELETALSERDKVVNALRVQHEKELTGTKDKAEKELAAMRDRLGAELANFKVSLITMI